MKFVIKLAVYAWEAYLAIIIVLAIAYAIRSVFKRNEIKNKYIKNGLINADKVDKLPSLLIDLSLKELSEGNCERALSYIKESEVFDTNKRYLYAYSKYYNLTGKQAKADDYYKKAVENRVPEAMLSEAERLFKIGYPESALSWLNVPIEAKLPGATELKEKIEKSIAEVEATKAEQRRAKASKIYEESKPDIEKADLLAKEQQDYNTAAKMYERVYHQILKAGYHQEVPKIAMGIAIFYYNESCKKNEYNLDIYEYNEEKREASYKWLKEVKHWCGEDFTNLPEYYYVRAGLSFALEHSRMRRTQIHREYSYGMKWCYEDIKKAAIAGVPEAIELKEEIYKAYMAEIEREKSLLQWDRVEREMFMEEHGGMDYDEFKEYQTERAENRRKSNEAMAAKEHKAALRSEIESKERDFDILMGGSGDTVEEKALRGDISQSDYANYNYAKEKYINNQED